MTTSERTQVGIVGAGPAGLLLGRMLELAGIDALVVEHRSRSHVEHRQRAGILEQGTVELVERLGAGERMHREGSFHEGIELLVDGAAHRIDFRALVGGRVALWPQTEVVKDLVAARVDSGARLEFEVSDVVIERSTPTSRCSASRMAPARVARSAATSSPGVTASEASPETPCRPGGSL